MKSIKYRLIICTICIGMLGYSEKHPYAFSKDLSKEDISMLHEGTVVIKKQKQKTADSEIARVVGVILIQRPVEEVWNCILDWEKMPQYVDTLDYYRVIKKINSETSIIEGQIHVTFVKFHYTLIVNNQKKNWYQQWRLINDAEIKTYNLEKVIQPHSKGIKNIDGYQYCIPLDNYATLLYYAPIVEVSVPVPGFIEESLTKKSLNDYLYGLKRYLEEKN